MAKPIDTTPDLGVFFGDQGGPGTALPRSDAHKDCPFLDAQARTFCSLDGAMCPFVGFNYRKCKKYINNISRGTLYNNGQVNQLPGGVVSNPLGAVGGPRLEALIESKKGGSKNPPKDNRTSVQKELDDYYSGKVTAKDVKSDKKPAASPSSEKQPSSKEERIRKHTLPNLSDRDELLGSVLYNLAGALEGHRFDSFDAQEKIKGSVDLFLSSEPNNNLFTTTSVQGREDAAVRREFEKYLKNRLKDKNFLVAYYKKIGLVVDEGGRSHLNHVADAFLNLALEKTDVNKQSDMLSRATRAQQSGAGEVFGSIFYNQQPDDPGTETSNVAQFPTGQGAATGKPPENPEDELKKKEATDAKRDAAAAKRATKREEEKRKKAAKQAEQKRKAAERKAAQEAKKKAAEAAKGAKGPFQATSKRLTYDQFVQRFNTAYKDLTAEEKNRIFNQNTDYKTPEDVFKAVKELEDQNDLAKIAQFDTVWRARTNEIIGFRNRKHQLEQELDHQVEMAKKAGFIDEKTLKFLREDPARLGRVAKAMNTARQRLYTLETKNMNIGDQKITKFMLQATLPTLDRSDYEVMRMSEQLGLMAIKKQHDYGRSYGKFNTWNLLLKQVLTPILLLWTGHWGYIKPLLHIWPQQFLDQLYFAYVQSPLPKLRSGSNQPQLSRDSKFLASQKLASPRGERIMQGFDQDPAGVVMPPDRAVLHTRTYPTTKEPWSKIRNKVLTQRYQEVKARAAGEDDWRRGFLRGR